MPLTSTPPGGRWLAAGRLALLLDGGDLRYVSVDGVELLRRIHVPIRDEAWNTLEPDRVEVAVEESPDAIEVRVDGEHRSAAADVAWVIRARCAVDGTLDYTVELTPRAAFSYSRMGICMLHPPEGLVGRGYCADTPDGEVRGSFDAAIAPQRVEGDEIFPLFASFSALRIDGGPAFAFEGDLFELEDQRNWGDGSFKAYCTPLSVPRPHRAEPGLAVFQRVTMEPPAQGVQTSPAASRPVTVEVDVASVVATMPGIGLALAQSDRAGADPELDWLHHVRVDIREPARAAELLAHAAAFEADLVVALHLREAGELEPLAALLGAHADRIIWVLAFDANAEASTGPLVRAARERLGGVLSRARFAGGTDQWFTQLNRHRLDASAMDGVAWSVTPQVHGSDDLTIVESLGALTDQVESARALAPEQALLVGPVTLRPRYNPAAADAQQQALDPPQATIDPRQSEPFAAAWTAGSVARLAASGPAAISYYETRGPRGVVAEDGAAHPCLEPLVTAAGWAGWDVLAARTSEPLAVQALAVRDPGSDRRALMLANLRAEPTAVRVIGLGDDAERIELPGHAVVTSAGAHGRPGSAGIARVG